MMNCLFIIKRINGCLESFRGSLNHYHFTINKWQKVEMSQLCLHNVNVAAPERPVEWEIPEKVNHSRYCHGIQLGIIVLSRTPLNAYVICINCYFRGGGGENVVYFSSFSGH